MSDYYVEISDYDKEQFGYPSNIIHSKGRYDYITLFAKRVWIEESNGEVKWMSKAVKIPENKTIGLIKTNLKLTEEELEEFFWIKLRAYSI